MPANNPNSPNAATIQGPGPTGNEGYPVAVVSATGADNFPVAPGIGAGPWAVTVADGADVAQGTTTDAEVASGNGTVIGLLKRLRTLLGISDLATNQSTTTPLGANAAFTGPYEDISQYASISITIQSDQSSQTLGVRLQFSSDGVNLDFPEEFSFTSTQGRSIIVPARARFFRLQYQNGAVPQASLRIQTYYRRKPFANAGDTLTQDGKSVLATTMPVSAYLHVFNGTGWDRLRGNLGASTLFASAARTATISSPEQQNFTSNGITLYLNVTAAPVVPGSGGLQVRIEARDVLSSVFSQLNGTSATLQGTGAYLFQIYPGATAPTSFPASGSRVVQAVGLALPRSWRATVIHLDGQSYTYSMSGHYTA